MEVKGTKKEIQGIKTEIKMKEEIWQKKKTKTDKNKKTGEKMTEKVSKKNKSIKIDK